MSGRMVLYIGLILQAQGSALLFNISRASIWRCLLNRMLSGISSSMISAAVQKSTTARFGEKDGEHYLQHLIAVSNIGLAFSALGGALLAQAAGIQNVVIVTVVLNGLALICCMASVGDWVPGRLVDVKQIKGSLELSQLSSWHISHPVAIFRTSSGFVAIRVVIIAFQYYLVTLAGPNQKRSAIDMAFLLLVMHAPMGLGHQYGELVKDYGAEPCAIMGSAFAAILVSAVSFAYDRLRQDSSIIGIAMALGSFGFFSNLYQTALLSDLTEKVHQTHTTGGPVLRMSPIEIMELFSALGTSLGPWLAFAPAGTLSVLPICLSITILYVAYRSSSHPGKASLVEPDHEASEKFGG